MNAYDVAVIGAGPAGSAAAIELARAGASVVLFEKSEFPRHKVCGEFLSPEVATVLDELGCGRLLDPAPRMNLACVHTRSGQFLDFPMDSPAFGLSRWALDSGLVRAAESQGATFVPKTDGQQFDAPVVIDASGRKSREGSTFGFKAHFLGDYPARVDLHFIDAGYFGVSPVENGRINVCGLIEKSQVRQASDILRATLKDAWPQEWPLIFTGPLDPGRRTIDHLQAGDAAAFLDPFTGDGISLALRSGRLAAAAALRMLNGESEAAALVHYKKELRKMHSGQFSAAGLLRFGAHRTWLEAPVSRLLAASPALRRTVFRITRGKTARSKQAVCL